MYECMKVFVFVCLNFPVVPIISVILLLKYFTKKKVFDIKFWNKNNKLNCFSSESERLDDLIN